MKDDKMMHNPDDCPNTARLLDWMGHCKVQHAELNTRSRDQHEQLVAQIAQIHAAIVGNGTEGLKSRVGRHSQQIQHVERQVTVLQADVDTRLDALSKSIGELNIRFWRMAIIVAVIVATANKVVQALDLRSIIGI